MNLKILYDSEAESGFKRGWGFSCLVEFGDERVLFDTGWDGQRLLLNMAKLDVKPDRIDRIIISHSHWDHLGGLPLLLRKGLNVYVPRSFSKRLKGEIASRSELQEVRGAQKICEGAWTTGELGRIKEQSLIVKTGGGLVVIVGCAHPGLRKIFTVASRFGKITGVVGGMHGFRDYTLLKGLSLIMPSHCTVNKKKIAELFPEVHVNGKAGLEITLE